MKHFTKPSQRNTPTRMRELRTARFEYAEAVERFTEALHNVSLRDISKMHARERAQLLENLRRDLLESRHIKALLQELTTVCGIDADVTREMDAQDAASMVKP